MDNCDPGKNEMWLTTLESTTSDHLLLPVCLGCSQRLVSQGVSTTDLGDLSSPHTADGNSRRPVSVESELDRTGCSNAPWGITSSNCDRSHRVIETMSERSTCESSSTFASEFRLETFEGINPFASGNNPNVDLYHPKTTNRSSRYCESLGQMCGFRHED